MDKNNQQIKIHTEGTPNPNALKFVIDRVLIESGSLNFPNKEKANISPLAKQLFEIEAVKEVLIGKDFITISKNQDIVWDSIYEKLLKVINTHFESNKPIVLGIEDKIKKENTVTDDVEGRIREILNNQIRPAVASDGGDIIFDSYVDGILKLHLQGSCSHCPSSIMTLKAGIETMLKRQIPELKEVISI